MIIDKLVFIILKKKFLSKRDLFVLSYQNLKKKTHINNHRLLCDLPVSLPLKLNIHTHTHKNFSMVCSKKHFFGISLKCQKRAKYKRHFNKVKIDVT